MTKSRYWVIETRQKADTILHKYDRKQAMCYRKITESRQGVIDT